MVVGDTGCRITEVAGKDYYQDCQDPNIWAFPKVANKASEEKPDLILHVGDYVYREICSDGKPCKKMTSVTGFGWPSWEEDFFKPAKNLLATAPWIFVRGNHENCKRAGEGWSLLLAKRAELGCLDYEEPQYVRLGDLLIVNFDSSSASEKKKDERYLELWSQRFEAVAKRINEEKPARVWLLTHKPIYGFLPQEEGVVEKDFGLGAAFLASGMASKVDRVFSGHIHASEVMQKGYPLQLIGGNSGTALNDLTKAKGKPDAPAAYKVAKFSQDNSFGYAVIQFEPNGKTKINFKDTMGRERKDLNCESSSRGKWNCGQ